MERVAKSTLENTDLSQFRGEWIAYEPESKEIMATGGSLKAVREIAQKKGIKRYTVMEVPASGVPFTGYTMANHKE